MNYSYDITNFKETFERDFTYINGFMRTVNRYAKRPALYCPIRDISLTYEELNAQVNKLANALAADGVKRGDVVLYSLYNSIEFALCYLAPQKLAAIHSPSNYRLAPGETAAAIEDNRPKVFIYDADVKDATVEALKLSAYKPSRIIMTDITGEAELPEGHIRFEDYIKGKSEAEPVGDYETDAYTEVTRFFTSGTTSRPKGVPCNNINEVLTAHDNIMLFPLAPVDVTMNTSPWFHRGGLHMGGPCPTFFVGGQIIILREFTPKRALQYIEKYGVTFAVGVPAILSLMAKVQQNLKADLSNLKAIITMGSPLEKEACIYFQQMLTPNICNGYGTTETFANTFLRPFDLPEMAGAAGRSSIDDDVRVVKLYDDRKAEPDDLVADDGSEVGEVIIKSIAKSAMCYINNEEETKEKFYKGYMYTKDLGTWDENHYVTIAGRRDDMIVSSGENIFPPQIEEVLNSHPKVADSIVTGVHDKLRKESIVAYVVPEDDSLTAKELSRYCAQHPSLSTYKCPKYYRFIDEVPRNATGKLLHYKAKEQALEDLWDGKLIRSRHDA
ncbi:MAG: class I adenylate-forming enzyme family protein [Bacillota bacterium]|nr:class I adenylate-forming enzyme family protein [Bacillota bacterium]